MKRHFVERAIFRAALRTQSARAPGERAEASGRPVPGCGAACSRRCGGIPGGSSARGWRHARIGPCSERLRAASGAPSSGWAVVPGGPVGVGAGGGAGVIWGAPGRRWEAVPRAAPRRRWPPRAHVQSVCGPHRGGGRAAVLFWRRKRGLRAPEPSRIGVWRTASRRSGPAKLGKSHLAAAVAHHGFRSRMSNSRPIRTM